MWATEAGVDMGVTWAELSGSGDIWPLTESLPRPLIPLLAFLYSSPKYLIMSSSSGGIMLPPPSLICLL